MNNLDIARREIMEKFAERKAKRGSAIADLIAGYITTQVAPSTADIEYFIGWNISVSQMVSEEIVNSRDIVCLFLRNNNFVFDGHGWARARTRRQRFSAFIKRTILRRVA